MSGRTKPRTRRVMRTISRDPIGLAILSASLLPAATQAAMLAPARAALANMRTATATEADWVHLVSATAVGLSIEHKGVVKGLQAVLTTADHALATIGVRAMVNRRWQAPTLYAIEITALAELVRVHAFQLANVAESEYLAARNHAAADTLRRGGRVMQALTVETTPA